MSAVGVALASLVGTNSSASADYPDRPVTIIVPYAAGGGTDIAARFFAEEFRKRLGQQFLVENLPGANGSVGTANAAKSPPDGYRLVTGSSNTMIMNPYMMGDVGYTKDDFVPIGFTGFTEIAVSVRPTLEVHDIVGLVAYAKEHPGELNYGSAGIGNNSHQAGELFKKRTGTEIEHIPYQGGAPAIAALLAGEVDVVFQNIAEIMPHIKSGKATPLAVMTPERSVFLPDVPTLGESGIKDSDVTGYTAIYAPAGTPKEILQRLSDEMNKIIEDPETRERLLQLGLVPRTSSLEEIAKFEEEQIPLAKELVDLAGGPQK
jgi:tripartite-type tricarboxylate transporter receptor subunit TctC